MVKAIKLKYYQYSIYIQRQGIVELIHSSLVVFWLCWNVFMHVTSVSIHNILRTISIWAEFHEFRSIVFFLSFFRENIFSFDFFNYDFHPHKWTLSRISYAKQNRKNKLHQNKRKQKLFRFLYFVRIQCSFSGLFFVSFIFFGLFGAF